MKHILYLSCIVSLLVTPYFMNAQQEEQIKIEIIEKKVDQDGKVTEEVKVLTGDEAREYILEHENLRVLDMENEKNIIKSNGKVIIRSNGEEQIIELPSSDEEKMLIENNVILDGEEIQVNVEVIEEDGMKKIIIKTNGEEQIIEIPEGLEEMMLMEEHGAHKKIKKVKVKEKKKYKIITIDDEGHQEVIEWKGEGEMPMDMKKLMDSKKHASKHHQKQKNIIKIQSDTIVYTDEIDIDFENVVIRSSEDGQKEIKIIIHDGDEQIYFIHDKMDGDYNFMNLKHEGPGNTNKAFLGVNIENGDKGVRVIDFVEPSAAQEAGMEIGDEIFKVGKKKVATIEALVNSLKDNAVGDKVKIKFYRDGKKKSVKAFLKERPITDHSSFEWIDKDHNELFLGDDVQFQFLSNKPEGKEIVEKIVTIEHRDKDEEEIEVTVEIMHEVSENIEKEMEIEMIELEKEMENLEFEMKELEKEMEMMEERLEEEEIIIDGNTLELSSFKTYPNPTEGMLTLAFVTLERGDLTIKIVDITGKLVLKEVEKDFQGAYEKTFDLSKASKGNISINILQNKKLFSQTAFVQ